jgi:hypothetical protein
MRTARFNLSSAALIGSAVSALLAGCGGSGTESPSQAFATGGSRMQAMTATAVTPSVCPPTVPNIDTGAPVPVDSVVRALDVFKEVAVNVTTVSWGDKAPDTVDGETHTYHQAGVYTVLATSLNCGPVTTQVVVYDPAAGFVTGGGWIDSPQGAYPVDPNLAGRANFGFVSKYHKGAAVPSGQTEFQFQAGKLNFHSDSYDWLVVAGARAQFKGTGTVNGAGGFRFLLTAIDGALLGDAKRADRFRIKIWHADASGADILDYDNQAVTGVEGSTSEGTDLSGGSIVIHK